MHMTDAGRAYLHTCDQIEKLLQAGQGESPKSHALCDQQDRLWRELSATEQEFFTRASRHEIDRALQECTT